MREFNRFRKHFPSLQGCVEFIGEHFPLERTVQITSGRDIATGQYLPPMTIPAFAYRGESRRYPTTSTSLDRMLADPVLSVEIKRFLEETTIEIDRKLQEFMHFSPQHSAGFLQHYGAPTRLLDVTTSIAVAAYFASGALAGANGLMCVLPLDVLTRECILVDLRDHPGADRPRRQSAIALFNRHFDDLKSEECVETLQTQWFSFELNQSDITLFHSNSDLLDAHTDKVAGVLQLIIDGLPKMPDLAAQWLSNRIAAAPFLSRVVEWYGPRQPKTGELVPASEAGIPYDEDRERRRNRDAWSSSVPETRPFKLIERLGEVLKAVFPGVEILWRLGPGWFAGKDLDYLIPSRRFAFVCNDDSVRYLAASEWCSVNGYRLIEVNSNQPLTDAYVKSLL